MRKFRVGLIVNPYAGIGGSVALKGSDGSETRDQALALGAIPQANQRTHLALSELTDLSSQITFFTASGSMGEATLGDLGFEHKVVYQVQNTPTEAEDTESALSIILTQQPDIVIFAGGDGTARNIYQKIDEHTPVIGIPAGCKIHSGVYALTPKAAGLLLRKLVCGETLTLAEADVMDIDEQLFRQGKVSAKRFGEMQIPMDLRYIQAVKMGGKESEELVLADIAADVIERMEDELYLIGSGSTTAALMAELGIDNTLLGVDAVHDQQLLKNDLTEQAILTLIEQYDECKLVITLIGGQGHIFGRGNQQLSPSVIKKIGRHNILIIATKTKISKLDGKPLIVDTGDPELDAELSGPIKIITGYHDTVIYPIQAVI